MKTKRKRGGLHWIRRKHHRHLLLAEDGEELELFLLLLRSRERSAKTKEEMMDWDKHVVKCLCKKEFESWYRMSLLAFNKLVDLLCPAITCNEMKAMNSIGSVITPEIVVAIGLRWLSGAMYQGRTPAVQCQPSLSQSTGSETFSLMLSFPVQHWTLNFQPPMKSWLEAVRKEFSC